MRIDRRDLIELIPHDAPNTATWKICGNLKVQKMPKDVSKRENIVYF